MEATDCPILLIDDEDHVRLSASQTLELAGFQVRDMNSALDALSLLSQDFPGIVITDIKMPKLDGMAFLGKAKAIDPDLPVILITGHGDVPMAVEAMKTGAQDFIEKPFAPDHLVEIARRAAEKRNLVIENRRLRQALTSENDLENVLVGETEAMRRLRQAIISLADTDADVLILGETGTGKEMVARSLHDQSSRKGNFVAVNCGAMPETIIESELFGHEAGAFTGAEKKRIGKFEYADNGTLFLDEIESMPMQLQVKMLRVLQERHLERLGSNEPIPLNLRTVAATKVNLREASDEGSFREDLYYRLNVVTLRIPPLRERKEDIPRLFQHFVLKAAQRYSGNAPTVSTGYLQQLMTQEWPGNVRELRNAAERFVLSELCGGLDLETTDGSMAQPHAPASDLPLPQQVEAFERGLISQELARQGGNVTETCQALGLPRKTLYEKMKKYGLSRQDFVE